MNIIFCLVSRQTMPNVLPVLMYKPEKVVLFETPEESQSAENLYHLFKNKNIQVERVRKLNAYDFGNLKQIIRDYLEKENNVALNITGGTKLMALAAYEAFKQSSKQIFYCDTEHKQIIHIFPDYNYEKLVTSLSIEEYLESYGYKIISKKDDSDAKLYFQLFDFINNNNLLRSFIKFFSQIRKQIQFSNPKFSYHSPDKQFSFIKEYDKYIIRYKNSNQIVINSSNFKIGDWLEYYVYYQVKKKYNLIPYLNVKIQNNNVENEIDLLFIKDYKLYLISCKSGRSNNQYDLYQLETLRTVTSGTFGKGVFITANKNSNPFLKRASELKIKVLNIFSDNLELL
ncbi:MAG: Card1-like endonuclease domain-containing protein [Ignavibacteria bacterium]